MQLQRFIVLAVVGLAAQLVDGALGMAYALTSTTLLLASGLTPALALANVRREKAARAQTSLIGSSQSA